MRSISLGIDQQGQARRITLNAALTRYWLEHVCQGTTKPQLPSYRDLRRMSRDLLRLLPAITGIADPGLHEIDDDAVARYRTTRRGEPQRAWRKPATDERPTPLAGGRTVNAEIEHLRAVVTMARETWRCTVDPEVIEPTGTRYLQPVKWGQHLSRRPDSPKRTLTAAQQALTVEWCADPARRAYAHVGDLLTVGIWEHHRKTNLVTLDWSQIDMQARTYSIAAKSKKPGGEIRTVDMSRAFFMWLANREPKAKGRVFQRWNPNAGKKDAKGRYTGAWQDFNEFKRAWNTVRRECALGDITFHQATRKTGATRILNSGGTLADAQVTLGHSDIKTTMRYLNVEAHGVRNAKDAAAAYYDATQLRHSDDDQADDAAPIPSVK